MDPRRKKLKYRAWHRGFVEADLILGPFADAHLERMDEAELGHFEILLEQADHDIYAWIFGQSDPPADMDVPVLALIREFRFDPRRARNDLGV